MKSLEEEASISEITIMPDGRVYVFGMSDRVLEILGSLNILDAELGLRLKHLSNLEPQTEPIAHGTELGGIWFAEEPEAGHPAPNEEVKE